MAQVAFWDPFWFMREMFRWGSSSAATAFDVAETKDAYVYKAKLALPAQVDAGHLKAELDNGQLTLVVPKALTVAPASAPPTAKARRATENGRGSAAGTPRRKARSSSRRG
jgi:hypothetical protein